jgi:hypothetical protein
MRMRKFYRGAGGLERVYCCDVRRETVLMVVGMLAAAGAIVALARPRAAAPGPPRTARSAAARTAAPPSGPAESGPLVTREEKGSTSAELPPEVARGLVGAALTHLSREGSIRDAIASAREGRLSPVDLGLRLHDLASGHPEAGGILLDALLAERNPEIALKLAQALAGLLDDERLRRATIEALRAAPPEARATGLLALLGRGESDALDLAGSSFVSDAPEARGTAGFLLNNAPGPLPEAVAGPAREAARAALAARESPERVREESLGLLGRPGAGEADIALIERALLEAPEAAVRARALAALVATEAPAARIRPPIERLAEDPSAPEPLRQAARAWLATAR